MPTRHGLAQVTIRCAPSSSASTLCVAPVSCSLYDCAPGTPTEVTNAATWSVDNTAVARVIAPGTIQAVGVGHTVLRVSWTYSNYFISIGVFAGTAPLQTYEYEGSIFDGGGPPRTPLDGALVEILDGLPAGRTTTSGGTPEFIPGATIVVGPGHYAFFGVPEGTYRLRVSKSGYVAQEVETRQFMNVTLVPQ
jgi:hypothetical protein